MNAFTDKKSPGWLKDLNRDYKNKVGGGAARAKNSNGVAVPSLSNQRGVKALKVVKQ
jgi:hypothetical protein